MIDQDKVLQFRSTSTEDLRERQKVLDQALMAAKLHGVAAEDLEDELNAIYCELSKREIAQMKQ